MKGIERHYFPGNNTPGGFFSYHNNIIDRENAKKIWIIKGGPGTGKSTLMEKVGVGLLHEGISVDFLHCASDSESIDGIVVQGGRFSILDGTMPHALDPLYPGIVETIVNLEEFCNDEKIKDRKREIIQIKKSIAVSYCKAFNYLAAAEKVCDNMQHCEGERIDISTAYKVASGIVNDIYADDKCLKGAGVSKSLFASAITPEGIVSHLNEVVGDSKKVYVIDVKNATGADTILKRIKEDILSKGYDVETFFCSLKPNVKVEHLVVPKLSFSVVTSNAYHEFNLEAADKEIIRLELNTALQDCAHDPDGKEKKAILQKMNSMMDDAIYHLGEAKKGHTNLEAIYSPHMDFEKVEEVKLKIEKEILESVLEFP